MISSFGDVDSRTAGGGWWRPPLRQHALALAGIVALVLFAYSNSLHGAFVFDDRHHIRDNALIRDLSNYLASGAGYRAMPTRFLAYVSFALNYRLGGLDVAGYHAFNVAIHVACATLVYALVVLTLRTPRLAGSSLGPSSRAVGFAAGSLFATHPLQTQAVTYIVQRITSLATLFFVLSVLLYAWWRLSREVQRPCLRGRGAAYALALLSAVAAMQTKEIAFTLPFALALYELSFFEKARGRWLPLAPFLGTAAIIPATLVNLHQPLARALAEADAHTRVQATVSRLDYLRTQVAVVAEYLRLLVLPVGQNLDHDIPVYHSFLAPRIVVSAAILLSLAGVAAWLYWRSSPRDAGRGLDPAVRLAAFGVAWFFLTLLVESSVIPILDVMNEHRVYLPSVGAFAAVAAGGALLLGRVQRARPGRLTCLAALFLSVILAVATLRRNAVWADDISVWADAASKSPGKARPFYNLGSALATGGHPEQAVLALRRAVKLDPGLATAHAQLAATLLALQRPQEAEPELRDAIALDPRAPEPIFNLALLLSRTGRAPEAKPLFRRFLEVAPPSYAAARRVAAANL
jgi:tetratricopeptide (TPR) repeat protein